MNSFTVTAASKEVKLDPKGTATVTFTVTNMTKKPVRGTPKLKAIGSVTDKWLKLPAEGTRNFSPEESQQFVVEISVPPATKTGEYSFGLNISNEALPDEDFTEGPAVAFKIEISTEPPPKKPFPWWILIVLAVVLIGGGVTIALLLKPSKITVPDVVRKTFEEASNLLAQASLRLEVTESLATGTNQIGIVIRQDPPAAEKVEKDALVKLAVERERDKVKVPPLVGLPPGKVQELFGALPIKFAQQNKEFTGTQPPGLIARQTPAEGQSVSPGETITYVVEDVKPEAPPPAYVGNWINEDTRTGGITKFDIRQQGGKIYVHMWGKCSPTDCDWGEMEARPSGSNRLLITWDQGFVVRSQTMTVDGPRIRLESRSNYKDGRAPQSSADNFKKRELIIIRDFQRKAINMSPFLQKP